MEETKPKPCWLSIPVAFFLGVAGVPLFVIWLYVGMVLWSWTDEYIIEINPVIWFLGFLGATMVAIMVIGYKTYRKYY